MRMLASLAARFSGGTHPRAVSLAVFLGLVAGFVQGWNLSLAALFVLIILFDVRSRVALVCWAIGLGLSWLMAPVTFLLGRVVLDLTPVGKMLGELGDGRAAALFGWDRYTVVGGMLVGLAIAWPASSLLTRGVRRTRRMLQQARDLRARLAPDVGPAVIAFPRSRISRKARLADWLRGKTAIADETTRNRLFRRGGLPAAAALVAVTTAVVFWQVPRLTSGRLYLAIQSANQARLEAASFHLALWDGRLEIRDLRLADPTSLTHDRLRVAHLRADVDPTALLRGHLAVKHLDVTGVRTNVERHCAAAPLVATCAMQCVPAEPAVEFAAVEHSATGEGVETCLTNWQDVRSALAQLGGMLGHIQSLQEEFAPRTLPLSLLAIGQTDIVTLRAARSPLGRPAPTIAIASVRVEDLDPNWHLGNDATLHAEHLTSEPVAGSGAARLAIDAPNCGTRVLAEYATHLGNPRWTTRVDIKNLAVARQFTNSANYQTLAIDGGQLSLTGEGWADANGFEIPLKVDAHDLACHAVGERRLAGISAGLWAAGLARLGAFKAEAICHGTWHEPCLEIDAAQVAEEFRHQLLMAGQHELLATVDAQIQPRDGQGPMPGLAQSEPPRAAVAAAGTDRYATPPATPVAAAPLTNSAALAAAAPMAPETTVPSQPEVKVPVTEPLATTPVAPSNVAASGLPITTQTAAAGAAGSPTSATAPTQVVATSPAAQSPVTTNASGTPSTTTSTQQLTTTSVTSTALGNDLPVIEVGHPGPSIPAPPADESNPVVAAVGSPLNGPGPVDLTVGYDVTTEIWRSPTPQPAAAVAQTPYRQPVNVQPDREGPSDAELDKWVQQQERLEAQRERALAKQAPLQRPEANLESDLEDPAPQDAPSSPGLFARMKRYIGFGKDPAAGIEETPILPEEQVEEPARVARGQKELPADRGATKLR